MIDKVDGPEDEKAKAKRDNKQSLTDRTDESAERETTFAPTAAEGFIPGLDGDLPEDELDALIGDQPDRHPPGQTAKTESTWDKLSPEVGEDEFADHPLFSAEPASEPRSFSPAESEPPSGFASIDRDERTNAQRPMATGDRFDSPDAAFANALSRYDDDTDDAWDDDSEPPAPPPQEVDWDSRPEFLLPMGEAEPDLEPAERADVEPVIETRSEAEPELDPESGPDNESGSLPAPAPAAQAHAKADVMQDDRERLREADAARRPSVPDVPVDPELAQIDDESVPLEKLAEAQRAEREGKIEAVGDDIGLPPDLGIQRNAEELDDFDDFDDLDDFEAPPIASAMPAASTRERVAPIKESKREPSDEFDDDDLDEDDSGPMEPRRVGNHVNLDLEHLSDIGVITPDNARGKVAEEYRLIKRPLLLNVIGEGEAEIDDPNIIMVTSSLPGEGKTFTSVNLAMSMAMELDRTVLLVDADVAKPSFSRVFDMETEGGLIDVLLGDATMEEVLLTTNVPKLRLLPAGRRHANSVELLASDHMRRLTKELATRYENRIIVFDSPPLLATTEAGVLASLMSQIVLVVEANKTPQYVVQESLNILDRSKYIGTVLNKSRSSGRSGYYYDYRYPYYYGYGQ
ncbi:MAG: XrtA-associated tyrosine autokinase [Gammaproteobacteria bacterium]